MRKIYFLMLFILLFAGISRVQAQEQIDLPDPGLTPQSAFYFFDRLGDWMRLNVLTFNSVRKAEIKAEIAEERLAELNDIFQKAPEKADIIEKLEVRIKERINSADEDARRLDEGGRDIARLVENLSSFSLKRQQVLENAIERVSDEVKDKVESALNNVYKSVELRREILLRQRERGFVSDEKAREIIENQINRLQSQLENQKNRVEKIGDPALKERLENIIEKKLDALENEILAVESRDDLKEVKEKIKSVKQEATEAALRIRRELKLRASAVEESLEEINKDSFDVKERAGETIKKARRAFLRVEEKIQKTGDLNISIPEAIAVLMKNGREHLKNAELAFENAKYGEAFGQGTAALRAVDNAELKLERLLRDLALEERAREEKRKEGKVCLQVFTPARNIKTNGCRVFNDSCLPEGWKPDQTCENIYRLELPEVEKDCAQVETPARNIETNECRIFRNSCIPDGWKRDKSCEKAEIERSDSSGSSKIQEEKVINMTAKQWSFVPEAIKVKQGIKVVLNIRSVDVAHGFSLPDFGINATLEPGRTEKIEFTASKTGIFRFRCSVFCGAGHNDMVGTLTVE